MCHQIAWYHALCYHQNSAYNIPIFCNKAVKVGYECYKPDCTLLPIFGTCMHCKHPTKELGFASGCSSPGDSSLSSPYTPDPFSGTLFNQDLEEEDAIGDDSGIYLNDGDGVAYVDEAGLELFDMITF